MKILFLFKYNIVKGGNCFMYGYGYPGYGCGCGGYGYGGSWIWIIVVVLIIFFVLFWGTGCNNDGPHHCR